MTKLLFLAGFLTLPAFASANPKSNTIVFVMFDAVRYDHVGVYGYERPTTPTIDALAKESTRYTRAYANAPWTRPSTATFLTGLFASRHQVETDASKLADSITTLAARLKKRGYYTAGFSANGNGGSLANLQKDFDLFEDPTNTYERGTRGKTYCCNGLPSAEFLTRRVLAWLDKDTHEKRFLFLFYVDPHDPYGAPPDIEEMFLGKGFSGKVRRHASWEYDNDYPPDERFALTALYDAGIHYADREFAKVLAKLKEKGIYDDATILFTGDHGEGFGEHGFYLHAHHFWEEVIHIPLVIKGPRFAADTVETRLTQAVDVATTMAEIAGADTTGMHGTSLLAPSEPDAHLISEYNEYGIHRQAIIGERYKVIWQRPADRAWFLRAAKSPKYFPSVSFDREVIRVFDLKNDPGEESDLAVDMPAEAAALLQRLRGFVAESGRLRG